MDSDFSNKSYYEILGVDKDASDAKIKKSFRKIIKECHPDRLPDDKKEWGEKMTKEVNEAWKILQDPQKREIYDQFGKDGAPNGMHDGMHNMHNMHDIVNEMMRRAHGGQRGGDQHQNVPPVKIVQNVSLEEIYNGKKVNTNIERYTLCDSCDATGFTDKQKHDCKKCGGSGFIMQTQQIAPGFIQQFQKHCNTCSGSGHDVSPSLKCESCNGDQVVKDNVEVEFDIPKGVKDRDVILLRNMGNEVPIEDRQGNGVTRGPVQIYVNELDHETFKRGIVINGKMNPANICIIVDITLADALTGFKKTIEHLDGRRLYFDETDIIKDGDIRVILNEGLPIKGKEYAKGDLFIKYNVRFPDKLNGDQRMGIYKILTGNDHVDIDIPEDYVLVDKFNVDKHGSSYVSYSDDDSDDEDEMGGGGGGGPSECRTQ